MRIILRNVRVRRTPCGVLLFLVLLAVLHADAGAQEVTFDECYARWTSHDLVVGNSHIERRWSLGSDGLQATSLLDRDTGIEWLSRPAVHAEATSGPMAVAPSVRITPHAGVLHTGETPSLTLNLTWLGSSGRHDRLRIFPAASAVELESSDLFPVPTAKSGSSDSTMEERSATQKTNGQPVLSMAGLVDRLPLAPQHLRLTEVTLTADTDEHNQLVSRREWMFMNNDALITTRGNVSFVEDVLTSSGLLFLVEAPPPVQQARPDPWDISVDPASRTFRIAERGYTVAVLAYHGGRIGRIEALQTLQRQIRPYVQGRDGTLLTNTWGDRSRDARINASFIAKEIEAGAHLGTDVMQIDDGWQQGRSVNSARGGGMLKSFWQADPPFWEVDQTRFPSGLNPLVDSCATHGMALGLWYAPDSSDDFANWERDAAEILELYHHDRVRYFKFDSIEVKTPLGEQRLHMLLDRIFDQSDGAITIDLDITAGRRLGYFGAIRYGPLFLENRYTDFHRYWPHMTLRNLWELSEFVDPLRLRMEFLNNTRSTANYLNDPLAPAAWRPDALFATVMMANPLGWFEVSSLPMKYTDSVAPLVKKWKQERNRLYSGFLLPIGQNPDGVAWTGFASVAKDGGGYLLLFRELNEDPTWAMPLSIFPGAVNHLTVLGGEGSADLANGQITVRIPLKLGFLWLRVDGTPPTAPSSNGGSSQR